MGAAIHAPKVLTGLSLYSFPTCLAQMGRVCHTEANGLAKGSMSSLSPVIWSVGGDLLDDTRRM